MDGSVKGLGPEVSTVTVLCRAAYCVSTQNFVAIARDEQDKEVEGGVGSTVTADFVGQRGGARTVEAVVTGVQNETSLFAQSIEMQAQINDAIFHMDLWRTVSLFIPILESSWGDILMNFILMTYAQVVNGTSECSNCSSIALQPFPLKARRIKVHVVFPAAMTSGILYLASIPYQ